MQSSLKQALYSYAKEKRIISRESLRNYGMKVRTTNNRYGFDIDSVNRRIRELQQAGKLVGMINKSMIAVGNEYIKYFKAF